MRTSLVVTPTAETRRRLEEMISSSVLTLDFDLMNIEVAHTLSEVVNSDDLSPWHPNPDMVYDDLKVEALVVDYIQMGGDTVQALVANVQSPKLRARSAALNGKPMVDPYKWVLKYDLAIARSTRLVINTLVDALVYREQPFSFSEEMLLRV